MTKHHKTPQVDKWILSPPGGPAGPFWGIVTQSGKVIAFQIIEQQYAETLRIMGNLLAGDFDTHKAAGKCLFEILDRDFPDRLQGGEDYEGYMVRAVVEVILGLAIDCLGKKVNR